MTIKPRNPDPRKKERKAAVCRLCLAFWLIGCSCDGQAPLDTGKGDTGQTTFVALSDLHFDPFYDPSIVEQLIREDADKWRAIFEGSALTRLSTYGSETNYPLLRSLLDQLAALDPPPGYVLYTGDFLAHDFHSLYDENDGEADTTEAATHEFIIKTHRFLASSLTSAFPGVPVFPVLGNNDSFCGDYRTTPHGEYLERIEPIWQSMTQLEAMGPAFRAGGHYRAPHPAMAGHEFLLLNNVFFSTRYENACDPESREDPAQELLDWLTTTLEESRLEGSRVTLAYHIPPGIDVFQTTHGHGACRENVALTWKTDYLAAFLGLVESHVPRVRASFAGHFHMDTFTLTPKESPGGFVHVTPGITPLFGNNPGYRVFRYNHRTGTIVDYETYYLDVAPGGSDSAPAWSREYVFSESYEQRPYNATTLRALAGKFESDPLARGKYQAYYAVSTSRPGPIKDDNWDAYRCALTRMTATAYADCACAGP